MNLINDIYGQFKDLFNSMTPGARLTTLLLAVLVVVAAGYLFVYREGYADDALFGARDFSNSDLATMETKFAQAGLNNHEVRGARMYVPRGQRADYLRVLDGLSFLGNDPHAIMKAALEDNKSPLTTKDIRDRNHRMYIEREISRQLQVMDGIKVASVRVDIKNTGSLRKRTIATAAVGIESDGTEPVDAGKAHSIREFVAANFAELSKENVEVLDLEMGVTYSNRNDVVGNDDYAKRKTHYENKYRSKIIGILGHIDRVRIQVDVELTDLLSQHSQSMKIDPTRVGTTESESSTNSRSMSKPGTAGRTGFASNVGTDDSKMAIGSGNIEETVESTDERTKSEPSRDVTVTQNAGLTPKRGKASIGIPMSYVESLWRKANPDAAADAKPDEQDMIRLQQSESVKIRESVANLLPPESSGTPDHPHIAVTFFEDRFDVIPPAAPATTGLLLAWINENWKSIGMMAIAAFGILMLRSMVKASEAETSGAVESPSAQPVADRSPTEDNQDTDVEESALEVFEGGPDLREELLGLVQADPEGAVNKLRLWLSEVS